MKRLIYILVLAAVTACVEPPKENDHQRYEFCSLETCEDQMSAEVFVCPHPGQEPVIRWFDHPTIPAQRESKKFYSLEKDNWVVRIKLVTVQPEEEFEIWDRNETVTEIENDYCKQFNPSLYGLHIPLTAAKITSDIVITADCQLYGRPPGTNLADKFMIPFFPKKKYEDEQYVILYDEHEIIADLFADESAPMKLTDYFFPGVMAHRGFWLRPSESYEEDHEKIHFHLDYEAWTELFGPYADIVGSKYKSKGSNRHLFADFDIVIKESPQDTEWDKNNLRGYPW